MSVLASSHPFGAQSKSMPISHLGMTGGIGLLCGVVLAVLMIALTKRQSA